MAVADPVVFFSEERVILAPTSAGRIDEYERLVRAHAAEAVTITWTACPGGQRFGNLWYVCGLK